MVTLLLLCFAGASAELQRESPASWKVREFLTAVEQRRWQVAEGCCTTAAQVQGVPDEEPGRRWTKPLQQWLREKPSWCTHILQWDEHVLDGSGSVVIHWRQGHLTILARFDLVKLAGDWKIDHVRYSTRRDASGTPEQWKQLQGIWEWEPSAKELENSILRRFKLDLRPDDFSISYAFLGINLFGPARPDQEYYHHNWRVRLLSKDKAWWIRLRWPGTYSTDGMIARYKLKGDELHLWLHSLGTVQLELFQEPFKLVLKRR